MRTLRQDLARWRLGACLLLGGAAGPLLVSPSPAFAAPGDDWALEHDNRSPELLDQRFAKLRQSPLDAAQWRALEAAAGRGALIKRIDAAAARAPDDVALTILRARARLAENNPREAATILATIRDRAGRWRGKVIDLELDARIAAGELVEAIAILEASGDRKSQLRAFELAERGQLDRPALRLARALASNGSADDQLRLARAAVRAGEETEAETAFAAAHRASSPSQRPTVAQEWARARIRRGDITSAAEVLWTALGESSSAAVRESLWSTLADCYARDGRGELGIQRLEAWVAEPRHARDAAAWRTLARVRALQGIDPIAAWREAIALDPGDRESVSALILAIDATGDADATVAEFRRLGGPKNAERLQLGLEVASRVIANGHRELGMALAEEISAAAGRSPTALLGLLDFYNLHDETALALAIAERLVKLFPRDPEARIALGEQLYQMRREADALAEWSALPKLIRPAHRGWARYAEILAEHRHPDALVALQRALAAAPHEPSYIRLRALLEQEGRVPQRALTSWQEILDVARGPAHRLLRDEARTRVVELLVSGSTGGKSSIRRRDAERAALATLKGNDPIERKREAALFLAELYGREARHDEAVEMHEALVAMAPEDPERLAALAFAQRRAGRGDAAMLTLEKLLTIDPRRSSDVLAELAEMAFDAGDLERALDAASRAAAAGADSSTAIVRLGELYERRGDIDEAAKTYAKALEIAPRDPLARLRLAELTLARGQTDKAAVLFREIVEAGGPPELVQEAGRRALDLAEASANTIAVVELAMIRAQHEPTAEEPRELLLDALDRTRERDVRAWLAADRSEQRTHSLRRALVVSLTRDSIGMRLRAAEHLGTLGLPGSAVPLARMGAQLTAPRDAPRAVKDAYAQARAAALFAAGALGEAEAAPIFAQVVANRSNGGDIRYAAAWALLQRGVDEVALRDFFTGVGGDPVLAALACLAVAETPPKKIDAAVRATIALHAQESRSRHERYACAAADAVLTADADLATLTRQLSATDPILAAIASWRLGRAAQASESVIEALTRRTLGPNGVARDAAASALGRLLGRGSPRTRSTIPQLRGHWETTVERWLIQRTTSASEPIRPSDLRGHEEAIQRALDAARTGTRAEREAAREAMEGCQGASAPALCLPTLLRRPTPSPR